MTRPLEGLLVVALEQAVAAPTASCRLADAGARVIKIERAEGDMARHYDDIAGGESAYFLWLNRGKESVVLDYKDPEDAALLHRMLERADVFIQNLSPGAAARAGFGSAELSKRYPRLICCDISGYGEDNDYREMRAYDLLVQAESGIASITGTPDAPGRIGVSACDVGTGMNAHAAILEALLERERTGRGKVVKVSLFDSMADWMAVPLLHYEYGGNVWPRVGLNHATITPYGAYPLGPEGDDQIMLAVQNDAEFARLCREVLDKPGLPEDSRFARNAARVENRAALDAEIVAVLKGETRATLTPKLAAAKLAFAFVNTVAELARHPALHRRDIEAPRQTVSMVAQALRREDDTEPFARVPAIGEHTQAIRKEFA